MKKNIKLIIFDLYNTLVKPGRAENSPYEKLFRFAGLTNEEKNKFRGIILTQNFPYDKLIDTYFKDLDKDIVGTIKEYLNEELDNTQLFPETVEVLEHLYTKYDLCLMSNASADFKKPFYKLGLDKYFDKVIFSCDVGYTKPNPSIYKLAMKGHIPQDILMVGDSLKSDYNGSRAVGINSILIDRRGSKNVDDKINNLKELI